MTIEFSVTITTNYGDTKFTFKRWEEVTSYLSIGCEECGDLLWNLPAMSKEEWKAFKRAGDTVLDSMSDEQ